MVKESIPEVGAPIRTLLPFDVQNDLQIKWVSDGFYIHKMLPLVRGKVRGKLVEKYMLGLVSLKPKTFSIGI
jgi:hypothetical protein